MDIGIMFGIVGILVGIYFGVRSIFQSSDIDALQSAQRANIQAMYNHFWRTATLTTRIGTTRDDSIVEAREVATSIHEITIAARTQLVAVSREHALFIPNIRRAMGANRNSPSRTAVTALETPVFSL